MILSIFDNNGSYDQIGFGNFGTGSWDLAFSFTSWLSGPCSTLIYHYQYGTSTTPLAQGSTYRFTMYIYNNHVNFLATTGSTVVLRLAVNTETASWFVVDSTYSTCGKTPADYTDYEEAWMRSSSMVPKYNFVFRGNDFENLTTGLDKPGSLLAWYSQGPPSPVTATVSGKYYQDLDIHN